VANPGTLRLATLKIGRDDTGAGGLVPLTGGKPKPIIRFGEPGWEDPPVIVAHFPDAPKWRGTPEGWQVRATISVLVPETAVENLEHTIADRLAARLTNARYTAKGVDTTVVETGRRPGNELTRGLIRLDCQYQFTMSV